MMQLEMFLQNAHTLPQSFYTPSSRGRSSVGHSPQGSSEVSKDIGLRGIVKYLAFQESNSKSDWNIRKKWYSQNILFSTKHFPLNVKFSFSIVFKGAILKNKG